VPAPTRRGELQTSKKNLCWSAGIRSGDSKYIHAMYVTIVHEPRGSSRPVQGVISLYFVPFYFQRLRNLPASILSLYELRVRKRAFPHIAGTSHASHHIALLSALASKSPFFLFTQNRT
jgi:hypothetical protein